MYSENATNFLLKDLDNCISTLPLSAGAYALQLHLNQNHRIQVGKFAQAIFPAGEYIYLGSAHGPGGLRARLGRHMRGTGKPHWHIDYLRCVAEVQSAGYILVQDEDSKHPMECTWSQALSKFHRAYIPLAGFGAGDCHSGCQAHLVGFPASYIDILERFQNTYSLVIVNCQNLKTTG